jgi:hypothetical protein
MISLGFFLDRLLADRQPAAGGEGRHQAAHRRAGKRVNLTSPPLHRVGWTTGELSNKSWFRVVSEASL